MAAKESKQHDKGQLLPPPTTVFKKTTEHISDTPSMDLNKWSVPHGVDVSLVSHSWPMYIGYDSWLAETAAEYGFCDSSELLRHLIFAANIETKPRKKLIFKIIRCLHCHAGARAGFIPKKPLDLQVYGFQMAWLNSVGKTCGHPDVGKTVRILIDFYKKKDDDETSFENLMSMNRQ
jgi:hypothetical protein